MRLSGTIWDYLELSGTIWDYLEIYLTIWDYLGASKSRREQVIAMWNFYVISFFSHLRFLEELALLKINELLTLLKLTLCTRLMLNCSQNCIYFQMNCLFLFWKIVGENMDGIHNQKYLNSWFLFGQSWPTDTNIYPWGNILSYKLCFLLVIKQMTVLIKVKSTKR